MSAPRDLKKQILGVTTIMPPRTLMRGARFQSAEQYTSFLAEACEDPGTFWMKLAEEIPWSTKPRGFGEPGAWFPGGELDMTAACLEQPARLLGQDEPAVFEWDPARGEKRAYSRAQLIGMVRAIVAELDKQHLKQGDRVLVALPAGAVMLAAVFAGLRLGFTCVPVDPSHAKDRIARRARDAACRGAIVDEVTASEADLPLPHLVTIPLGFDISGGDLPPHAVPSMHPAFVLADSSGQLFSLPTAGFLVQALSAYRHLLDGRGPGDVLWTLASSHHASALAAALGTLAAGGQVGIFSHHSAAGTEQFLDALRAVRPRVLFSDVKTAMRAIGRGLETRQTLNSSGPEILAIEGETLEPRVWAYLTDRFFDGKTHLVQVLSRPETGGFIAGPNPVVTPVRRSSVALPAPGIEFVIVDTQGNPLEESHGGLLALAKVIPGLAIELQQIETPLAIEVKARRDQTGYIWTMGEARVERSARESMTLPEIEALIAGVPGVDQVAVVRYPDQEGHTKSRAFVKPIRPTEDIIDRIRAHLEETSGQSAVPDSFQVVRALPCSRTGKLLRSVLRRISRGEPLRREDLDLVSDLEVIEEYVRPSPTAARQ